MQTKFLVLALTAATFAWTAAAQTNNAQDQTGAMAANASSGTTISAVLDKSVDAKKAKVGEQVEAKTTADARTATGTTIPRGSKLIGHVTEAKAHEKGSANAQSSLGIVFDRVVVKGGQEVPMHATIQAIAAAPQSAIPVGGDMQGTAPTGAYGQGGYGQGGYGASTTTTPRPMGGTMSQPTTGAPTGPVDAAGNVGAVNPGAAGQLAPNTTGVVGIKDLRLDTETSDSATGSVITSDNKNVKLDSGTQLVLRVTAQ